MIYSVANVYVTVTEPCPPIPLAYTPPLVPTPTVVPDGANDLPVCPEYPPLSPPRVGPPEPPCGYPPPPAPPPPPSPDLSCPCAPVVPVVYVPIVATP